MVVVVWCWILVAGSWLKHCAEMMMKNCVVLIQKTIVVLCDLQVLQLKFCPFVVVPVMLYL
ncbi:hypothetical protein MtrunA17_Chr7g0243621 [Medicago truncatula]|uniref:Transmembrane protein n=1 Tax=Medicago truncatula TaxID=3880 RepID=A0A396GZN5_MEDTR|nr:hypothetical protein MtrunA17_Chr7g0243621 [Medicago truncatula]